MSSSRQSPAISEKGVQTDEQLSAVSYDRISAEVMSVDVSPVLFSTLSTAVRDVFALLGLGPGRDDEDDDIKNFLILMLEVLTEYEKDCLRNKRDSREILLRMLE